MKETTETREFIAQTKSGIVDQMFAIQRRAFLLGIKTELTPKEMIWRETDTLELNVKLKGTYNTVYVLGNDLESLERADEFLNGYPQKLMEHKKWQEEEEARKRNEALEKELELAAEAEASLMSVQDQVQSEEIPECIQ